jgi:hypothetical protein
MVRLALAGRSSPIAWDNAANVAQALRAAAQA